MELRTCIHGEYEDETDDTHPHSSFCSSLSSHATDFRYFLFVICLAKIYICNTFNTPRSATQLLPYLFFIYKSVLDKLSLTSGALCDSLEYFQ